MLIEAGFIGSHGPVGMVHQVQQDQLIVLHLLNAGNLIHRQLIFKQVVMISIQLKVIVFVIQPGFMAKWRSFY